MMSPQEVLAVISRNIYDLMKYKQLTATDVSKRCHISNGAVSKILNAQMSMSINILIKLAKGLGVNIEDIMAGTYEHQKDVKIKKPMEKQKLFVGILTVGNKRLACIKNTHGEVLGSSELEGSLVLTDTFPNFLQFIKKSISMALNKTIDDVFLQNIGLAIVVHCYELEETLNRYKTNLLKYFSTAVILADWQVTYLADFGRTAGISLVIDKGVSLSYLHDQKIKKLGGWGFPVYDLGGESWLGLMAVRHTIEVYEGFDAMSDLSKNILMRFDGRLEKLIEFCIKNNKDPDLYCIFGEQVVHSYFSGGKKAKSILQEGYCYIERMIKKVDALAKQPLNISLNGSLAHVYKHFLPEKRILSEAKDEVKINLLVDIARDESK